MRCRVNNFSRDVNDGENYTVLLNQLKPESCSLAPLQTRDTRQRAEEASWLNIIMYCVLTLQFLGSAKCRQDWLQEVPDPGVYGCRKPASQPCFRR
jgi:hypothetical protein